MRLGELRAVARERLMAAHLALGRSAMLVADLEAMVAEEPLREERWRLLALALYRSHRQAAALEALRRARTVLADELGVDPGPALRELEGQVPSTAGLNLPQNLQIFGKADPNVRKPPTDAQIATWRVLVRVLQARYDIPNERIFAHNWIDHKDRRYCEGCELARIARTQGVETAQQVEKGQ